MRVVVIGFILFSMVLLAMKKGHPSDNKQFECIIQNDKVILNNYEKDKVKISIAFEEDRVVSWRKGQSAAQIKKLSLLSKNYSPYSEDKIRLMLFSSDSNFYFEGIVLKSCYDAF